MSKRLDENLGNVGYDGLIVANEPVADVLTVTIRKEATAAATYKRGTVLALSAGTAGDGKLVILGSTATTNETLTANCILAEDVEVGTTADVTVLAYERIKGIDRTLIDKPSETAATDLAADVEFLVETYEPRVQLSDSDLKALTAQAGDFELRASIDNIT